MKESYSSYKADPKPLPGLELSEHSDKIEAFINWIDSKGINVKNSRLPVYKKFLDSCVNDTDFNPAENDSDKEKFDKLLYVMREVHELMWIQKGIQCSEPEGYLELLPIIIGGKDFAKDDKRTIARNIQLELRIASYFLQEGYKVDMSGTTDLIAQKDHGKYFIECKRLNSPKKVNVRIKEASKQLKKRIKSKGFLSKDVAIAVFDVTKLSFPHQGLTWGVSDAHCRDVIQEKLKSIDAQYNFSQPFAKNKKVIGIWLQIHMPSLHLGFGQPTSRFSSIFITLAPSLGYRAAAFRRFQSVYEVDHRRI